MKKISFLFGMLATCITLQAASYGILVNGTTYFACTLNTGNSDPDLTEYMVLGVPLKSGDYFQLYDQENATAWTVTLDSYSTSSVTLSSDRYNCTSDGCYDFYIKLQVGNDQLYIGTAADCSGGIYYNFDDANLTAQVTYRGSYANAFTNEYTGDVVIPTTVTYDGKTYSVTSIGEGAFWDCTGLTSVTIPNSVTSIGYSAFYDCSGLTSVTIPNSVTSIGKSAFYGCSGLTSVVWNAKNCADFAPYYNDNDDYSQYYYGPFCDIVSKITSFTFGDEVEHIPAYLCYGMENLTSVTIPNSVTSIGEYAFYSRSGLTSVVWNAKNCADFSSSPFSSSSFSSSSFSSSITSFTFGNAVEHIPAYLCYGLSSLNAVTIGNSVGSIGAYAFYGCSSLSKTNYTGDIAGWCGINFPGYTSNPTAFSHNLYLNNVEVKHLVIPDGVVSIGAYAFDNCSNITSVTIPNSVTSIGVSAFYGCSGLTSVTIGNSVESIGSRAFSDCSSLTSVTIPNSVTSIVDNVFCNCSGLTSVTIGNSVRSIGTQAFWNCSGLTSITIPNSVISIGNDAFGDCAGLTSVTIGNSVESIGYFAFGSCSNLTSIVIPNSVNTLGHSVLFNCSGLTSVTIGTSVESIGYGAFYGCTALRELTALPTVPPTCVYDPNIGMFENVPADATLRCPCESREAYQTADTWSRFTEIRNTDVPDITLLTADEEQGSVQVEERLCESKSVVISATPQIGYAFARWSDGNTENPRTVLLAHDTTLTAEFGLAYSGKCGDNLYWEYKQNKLLITGSGDMYDFTAETQPWKFLLADIESVETSAGTTSVGASAFAGCSNLAALSLGTGVTQLGSSAFAGCTKLINIVCYAAEPPSCDASAFANYNVFLKVPCDNLMAYQTHVCWGSFKYISCIGSEEVQVTEFSVTPSTNEALFTWPAESGAATYELVISKDGVVFCTLTFNANGQLMGIAFAPRANASAGTTSGFQFTVTGLVAASHYTYTFDAKDAGGNMIKHYAGEFNTEGSTVGLEQIELANIYTQDGRIVCEGEFRIYDLLGRDVTRLNGSLCGVYVVKSGNAAVKVVVK
ncbi:MAG: leucine-rich repeat protein [Paludibacteraceae bacterium]